MRLHSVSICNHEADVLWLSEGALGPDEHGVVIEAIETLKEDRTQIYHEIGMEDGRMAIFLAVRAPRGDLVGTVMILADMKSLNDSTMERIVTPQMKTALQKVAVFMRKMYPHATDTHQIPVMPASAVAPLTEPDPRTPLEPHQVDDILTLELVDPPSPVAKAPEPPAAPATPGEAKGAGAKVTPLQTSGTGSNTAPAPKSPARAPTAGSQPAAKATPAKPAAAEAKPAPPPEIEVLDFDASISIPTVRPAAAAPAVPASDVLQFDSAIEIPTPSPAAAPSVLPGGEAIDFELEAPPLATPPAPPGVAPTAAPTTSRATVAPPAAPLAQPAPPSGPKAREPSKEALSPAKTRTRADAPVAAEPAPVPAQASSAQTSTDTVILINDTGKLPQLESSDETTTVEPALSLPESPPPPPLSAAETATDLTLYVQELIKLRSSGRTRRYEVLARSQRDADRNEVPTAFIAESAKGQEGAALDALVVERLLQWLGQHGEAIWDSEPASFSVNLSIGAFEDATFPDRIAQWLERYNVPAEYVGFELSEFACVQCKPRAERFVQACERMGCFLVIDNFSFDSKVFEFLGSKALRHVKIDPKLTSAAMKEKLPQALVVAILQACKVLGVHCVAKKIESQSALQWLKAVGCDFAQSFTLEKPSPLDSLARGHLIPALRE